ncbi:hypothetical protein LTR15_011355 [Elasticomyces elasticus]|nr:hypothetical protein LTR15_011355 [Elasticomyces elasticus]
MAGPQPHHKDEDAIVKCCRTSQRLLGQPDDCGATFVVRYEDAVVKFGVFYSREVANQRLAHSILDPKIVRVPEVYHYFRRGKYGFLVMEYINGTPCDTVAQSEEIERIALAIQHINSRRGDRNKLGPAGGGITWGVVWVYEQIVIEDMEDMVKYFNDRLQEVAYEAPVCFDKSPVVFVHCDIVQQNVIWCDDGALALLDSAHAGWYPRLFELAALYAARSSQYDFDIGIWDSAGGFPEALAARLRRDMNVCEAEQARKVIVAQEAGLAYNIYSKADDILCPTPSPRLSTVEQVDDTDSSGCELDDPVSRCLPSLSVH